MNTQHHIWPENLVKFRTHKIRSKDDHNPPKLIKISATGNPDQLRSCKLANFTWMLSKAGPHEKVWPVSFDPFPIPTTIVYFSHLLGYGHYMKKSNFVQIRCNIIIWWTLVEYTKFIKHLRVLNQSIIRLSAQWLYLPHEEERVTLYYTEPAWLS